MFFSLQVPLLIPVEKQQKSTVLKTSFQVLKTSFQNQLRESLRDFLALLKLHSACVICLPGRNAFFGHRIINTGVCMRAKVCCETAVEYNLFRINICLYVWNRFQHVHTYLLTRSRIKESRVLDSNGSSGMGHDALVTTTTAKYRLVTVILYN